MKSFKSYIKEASGFPTSPGIESPNNLGGSLEVNPTDVGDPSMLKRLNAIVGTIGNHEYLVAEHAISRLRGTLNKIGLVFQKFLKWKVQVVHLTYHYHDLVVDLVKMRILHMMSF